MIPHGSYIGVYPAGRSRKDLRAELGIESDELVLLSFGQIRRYKDLTLLVEAFSRAGLDRGVLLIAGLPLDESEAKELSRATVRDGRVVTVLEYVPDDRVAELYEASDVAVVARGDGGTSGALILALSMGLPVVAAALPAYEELTGDGRAGWHFRAGDVDSLCSALRAAASDPDERAAKGRAALERAAALSWPKRLLAPPNCSHRANALREAAKAERVEVAFDDLVPTGEELVDVVQNVEEPSRQSVEPPCSDVDDESPRLGRGDRIRALAELGEKPASLLRARDVRSTIAVRTKPGVIANATTPVPSSSAASESVSRSTAAFAVAYAVAYGRGAIPA